MLTALLIGFLAIAADAAPKTPTQPRQVFSTVTNDVDLKNKLAEADTKTRQFWQEYEAEKKKFGERLQALSQRFPNPILEEGIDGDNYKIIVALPNFKENEITVEVVDKNLAITAKHEDADAEDNFLNIISLPDNVEEGTWNYENNILTLQFPLTNTTKNDVESAKSE